MMGKTARRGHARSIRVTVAVLFATTLSLSLALIVAYETLVSSYYQGELTAFTRLFKPVLSVARTARISTRVMRSLNAALLDDPDAALDHVFLEKEAELASPLGVALRVGDRLAFASPPLDERNASRLPAFASLSDASGTPAGKSQNTDRDASPSVVFQMDFRAGSGEIASFFLFYDQSEWRGRPPFSRQLALIAALILFAADGAAGVVFILRVTGPLRRVESAALAMSRGDLETPVEGGYRFVELERVFGALETMRSEIRELLERERRSEAERRELIANLSHDLRTPVAAIRGYVDGLREGIADTSEKRERYLAVIGDKIQVLDRMIGQIFLLSTLDAEESSPELRRVDLRAFLSDSVEELRVAIGPGDAIIQEAGLEGKPRYANADPLQLRRVVENLVENSVRHGGRKPISVRIGLVDSGGAEDSDRIAFFVEDDGRGIAEGDRERAFERFWRGDRSRPGGGFGLGLAIARRIVEAQGGFIRAEGTERGGPGARFVVTLLAATGKEAER